MIYEESQDERLALNRMGSFDRDLARRTLELDAAGQAVFRPAPGGVRRGSRVAAPRVSREEGLRLDAVRRGPPRSVPAGPERPTGVSV
ncbi:hypothetical protein EW053_18100 [Streptomyces sp. IB2014 016-6]|nr:hypothetical protein EW053_18100 [Streptomyces sp. IB2014 016-6]